MSTGGLVALGTGKFPYESIDLRMEDGGWSRPKLEARESAELEVCGRARGHSLYSRYMAGSEDGGRAGCPIFRGASAIAWV